MTERWAPIPEYEGLYEVSDQGRVRSVDRMVLHNCGGDRLARGQMKELTVDPKGRPTIRLYRDGQRRVKLVHSLVLAAFVGPRPPGLLACHNDGDHTNNVLSNLRWDTPSANNLDSVKHGTHRNAKKTECIHGHPFTEENLKRSKRHFRRDCLTCARRRCRERRAALAARESA